MVGAAESGPGEPDHGQAHLVAVCQDGRTNRGGSRGISAKAGRCGQSLANPVADLNVSAQQAGHLHGWTEVGARPAARPLPCRPGRGRERTGDLDALLARQVRDVGCRERRGKPGEQGDGDKRDRDERQRQP